MSQILIQRGGGGATLVAAGSSLIGAVQYNGLTQNHGMFDSSGTLPAHTDQLNFDGNLDVYGLVAQNGVTIATGKALAFNGTGGYLNLISSPTSTITLTLPSIANGTLLVSLTSQIHGNFDNSVTTPAHTDRLNYDGNFYVNSLISTIDASINGLTIGFGPGAQNTNTVFGYSALNANTTGFSIVAVGYQALYDNISGVGLVAIGNGALQQSTGNYNTAIGGGGAGSNLSAGSNDLILGYNAQPSSSSASNEITLGNSAIATLRIGTTTIWNSTNGLYLPNGQSVQAYLAQYNSMTSVYLNNLLANGSFETGDTTGWIVSGCIALAAVNTPLDSAAYSGQITSTNPVGSGGYAAYPFTIPSGLTGQSFQVTYTFSSSTNYSANTPLYISVFDVTNNVYITAINSSNQCPMGNGIDTLVFIATSSTSYQLRFLYQIPLKDTVGLVKATGSKNIVAYTEYDELALFTYLIDEVVVVPFIESDSLATSSSFGLVKPDNSTIIISNGILSVPIATSSSFGLVKPDGISIVSNGGILSTTLTLLSGTAVVLAASNPIPLSGQLVYETDTKFFKIGDGVTAYNSLSYQPQLGEVAPIPQSGAGAGQWKWKIADTGATLSLDAGGTWAYLVLVRQDSSGYVWWVDIVATVASGGTAISTPGVGFTAGALVYETQDYFGLDVTKPILFDAVNNGYMVMMLNGQPFEILQSNQMAWADVQAWLAEGNLAAPYVPPAPVPPAPVAVANATLQQLMLKYINSIMVGPTPPLAYATQWLAAWKAAGN